MTDGLSESCFAAIIRQTTGIQNGLADVAAARIWELVAAYIEETENRIIDAEFALQEAEVESVRAASDRTA